MFDCPHIPQLKSILLNKRITHYYVTLLYCNCILHGQVNVNGLSVCIIFLCVYIHVQLMVIAVVLLVGYLVL